MEAAMADGVDEKKDRGKKANSEYLYHYLPLKYLIQILKKRQLCFCNPDYWEDKNDAYFAKLAMPKGKVFGVICFTKARETCTHWKTFASKGIGVKITFLQDKLLDSLKKNIEQDEKILDSRICYKARKNVLKTLISGVDKIFTPLFLKKSAYSNENEYRVACVVNARECGIGKVVRQVKIPLSCISRITISPYVQKETAYDAINLLKEYIELLVDKDEKTLNIEVKRSTMMYDKKWQMAGRELVNSTMKAEYANKENV